MAGFDSTGQRNNGQARSPAATRFYGNGLLAEVVRVARDCGEWVLLGWRSSSSAMSRRAAPSSSLTWSAGGVRTVRCHAGIEAQRLICLWQKAGKKSGAVSAVSVFARGWRRRDLVPRLLPTPGLARSRKALKQRKEMLTLDLHDQPIDKQVAIARPRRTRVRSPIESVKASWSNFANSVRAKKTTMLRVVDYGALTARDISATGRLRARNTIASERGSAFQAAGVFRQACL